MLDANVRGTERVLDAALDAGVERIVYVSTVNVFGNTRGEVVDETYAATRPTASSPTTTRPSTARTRSRTTGSRPGRRS